MIEDASATPSPKQLGSFSVAFSVKPDGPMERVQARRHEARDNRKRFLKRIGLPGIHVDWVRPTQSPNIGVLQMSSNKEKLIRTEYAAPPKIDTDYDSYYTGTDGVVTMDRSTAIGLISGDCVPLMVWDNDSGLHGIIHIGILGALNGTARRLSPMLGDLGVSPKRIQVYLGPSISKQNYDLKRSGLWAVIEPQVHRNRLLVEEIAPHYDGRFFDLRGLICEQLVSVGVPNTNIQYFSQCTASEDSLFFSHFAAKQSGEDPHNFCSVIWPTD